ncbi:hypothetical protein LTR86_009415 [Recurvomyces mirabilis]|nr:hypothetical protein LTR86_009415 [Recurvomyces mirabilis]
MERPATDKQVLGISDTSFSAELQVKKDPMLAPVMHSLPHLAVLATIVRYIATPGSTTLKLVRYWARSSYAIVYRLSLSNEADLHLFEAAPLFELDSHQFDLLLACGEHFEWLHLLRGLVHRTSYRAVYHVREQLARFYGDNGPVFEEQAWATRWATAMDRRTTDDDESAVLQATLATRAFVEENVAWQVLDMAVTDHGLELEVHSMTMFRALHTALRTVDTPKLICPHALNPVAHKNTLLVLEEFERTLYGIDYYQVLTPRQLYANLSCQANIATATDGVDLHVHLASLDSQAPWQRFLDAWLTRVVSFVFSRKCSSKGVAHAGMHRHGVDQFYNSAEWEQETGMGWDEEGEDLNHGKALPRAVREIDQMLSIADLNG